MVIRLQDLPPKARAQAMRQLGMKTSADVEKEGKSTPPLKASKLNGTEQRFADELEAMRCGKLIKSWMFEPIKLILADRTTYTPDFMVEPIGAEPIRFYEVKGFWRDDARVKIKVAARLFPMFRFTAVQWKKGQWAYEDISQ